MKDQQWYAVQGSDTRPNGFRPGGQRYSFTVQKPVEIKNKFLDNDKT
ncbi:MAG: hypothetical protein ABIN94_14690 [Ferruginibacter sp.]